MKIAINDESGDSMSVDDCECKHWCHDGNHWTEELIANHHYYCPYFETEFRKNALALLKAFTEAVDRIKDETGQIPDSLCKPYVKTKFAIDALCIDIHEDLNGCVLD